MENYIVGDAAIFEYDSEEKALDDLKKAWEDVIGEVVYSQKCKIKSPLKFSPFSAKSTKPNTMFLEYECSANESKHKNHIIDDFSINLHNHKKTSLLIIEVAHHGYLSSGVTREDNDIPASANLLLAKRIHEYREGEVKEKQ